MRKFFNSRVALILPSMMGASREQGVGRCCVLRTDRTGVIERSGQHLQWSLNVVPFWLGLAHRPQSMCLKSLMVLS